MIIRLCAIDITSLNQLVAYVTMLELKGMDTSGIDTKDWVGCRLIVSKGYSIGNSPVFDYCDAVYPKCISYSNLDLESSLDVDLCCRSRFLSIMNEE